jgi:histidyl-tRNA synthetase
VQSDLEIIELLREILQSLPIPKTRLVVNNRKVLTGYYTRIRHRRPGAGAALIDKLDKIGPQGVEKQLIEAGLTADQAAACLQLGQIKTNDPDELSWRVQATEVQHPMLEEDSRAGVPDWGAGRGKRKT